MNISTPRLNEIIKEEIQNILSEKTVRLSTMKDANFHGNGVQLVGKKGMVGLDKKSVKWLAKWIRSNSGKHGMGWSFTEPMGEGKLVEAKKFRVYDTNTGKTIKVVNNEKAGWKFIDILYKKYGNPDAGLAKVYEGKLNEGKTLTLPNGVKVKLDFKGVTFKGRKGVPVFLDRGELAKFFMATSKYLRY